jgi:hypothetical protein
MILQADAFAASAIIDFRLTIDYKPLHHLMITVSSALRGDGEMAVVTTIAKGMTGNAPGRTLDRRRGQAATRETV